MSTEELLQSLDGLAARERLDALQAARAELDAEAKAQVATQVLQRHDPTDPWRTAVDMLVESTEAKSTHAMIVELVDTMLATASGDVEPTERDQFPYQRLLVTVEQLTAARSPETARLLKKLAVRLLAEPISWGVGVGAWLAASTNDTLGPVLLALIETAPTSRAHLAIERGATAEADREARAWTEDDALYVIDTLMAEPVPARIIAAKMLGSFGARFSWNETWTSRLATLRKDAELDVQVVARTIWAAQA